MESGINHHLHTVAGISVAAEIETIDTYEDNIEFYQNQNFSYIPLPLDELYFDVRECKLHEIEEEQIIHSDKTLIEVVNKLADYPFLIYRFHSSNEFKVKDGELKMQHITQSNEEGDAFKYPRDILEEYPEFKDEVFKYEDENWFYQIVTVADLNKRGFKEMLYSIIAELETQFSTMIEEVHPDSKDLFPELKPTTIGRWQKAGLEDIQMHVAEYMTLSEMQKVVAKSNELLRMCGFDSRNQFDKQMSGIIDLRNRVMHASRTVVHGEEDVEQLAGRVNRADELVNEIEKQRKSA